jgi:myosin heavy subunit
MKPPTPVTLPQCVAASKVFKRALLQDNTPSSVSDMVSMSVLNEPEIVRNLKTRFDFKTTYTYIGPTLIALNPYERASTARDMTCLAAC